jgi:NADH-quinone oxidoreductase subunit J
MTSYALLFYIIAALILTATGLAVTRRNLVHAVVYLVISFFGTAMLFYLLGAPLLAALEVIVYAGAIMILFLFIIMMMKIEGLEEKVLPLRQWIPATGLCMAYLAVVILATVAGPGGQEPLKTAVAVPRVFGEYLFRNHWLAIEIASLLLLIALVGVLHLGRGSGGKALESTDPGKEKR